MLNEDEKKLIDDVMEQLFSHVQETHEFLDFLVQKLQPLSLDLRMSVMPQILEVYVTSFLCLVPRAQRDLFIYRSLSHIQEEETKVGNC